MASTRSGTRPQSSTRSTAFTRASTAVRSPAEILPFSTSVASTEPTRSTPTRASSGVASASTTSIPAWAASWAMPVPIWPAPTTAMRSTTIAAPPAVGEGRLGRLSTHHPR